MSQYGSVFKAATWPVPAWLAEGPRSMKNQSSQQQAPPRWRTCTQPACGPTCRRACSGPGKVSWLGPFHRCRACRAPSHPWNGCRDPCCGPCPRVAALAILALPLVVAFAALAVLATVLDVFVLKQRANIHGPRPASASPRGNTRRIELHTAAEVVAQRAPRPLVVGADRRDVNAKCLAVSGG